MLQKPTNKTEIRELMLSFLALTNTKSDIDKELKDIRDKLLVACGGEGSTFIDDCTIEIKVSDRHKWDQEKLAKMDSPHITKKLSVERKLLETLPAEDLLELEKALTISRGTVIVKVHTPDGE